MDNFFQHSHSIVESSNIGKNTRIWAFAHVLPSAIIGNDCNICDHVFIENDVVIGDRVTIKCGVQLWDGIQVDDDVFIGPNATFTNDIFPRSKKMPDSFSRTFVQKGASIGANATILAGCTIGSGAMIGAGAVIIEDVPPNAIAVGNPTKITGYVSSSPMKEKQPANLPAQQKNVEICPSAIPGIQYFRLPIVSDMRGSLSVAEFYQFLPFVPKRVFFIFNVPSREVRGQHAHKQLCEFLICVKGSCSVMVDDGNLREEYILDNPGAALLVPPMIWRAHYKYSPDAVLLVLASEIYDADDYIRDYDDFLKFIGKV